MWNGNDVTPAPDSWDVMFDPKVAAKYKGKISVSTTIRCRSPKRAIYLKSHEPDLGIENPYELNEEQFNAAVDLLKEQRWSANTGPKRRSRSPPSPVATSRSAPPGSTSTSR